MVFRGSRQTLLLILKSYVTLHEKYMEYDEFPEIWTQTISKWFTLKANFRNILIHSILKKVKLSYFLFQVVHHVQISLTKKQIKSQKYGRKKGSFYQNGRLKLCLFKKWWLFLMRHRTEPVYSQLFEQYRAVLPNQVRVYRIPEWQVSQKISADSMPWQELIYARSNLKWLTTLDKHCIKVAEEIRLKASRERAVNSWAACKLLKNGCTWPPFMYGTMRPVDSTDLLPIQPKKTM